MSRRTFVTGVVLTAILIAVAGCGTRGPLERPEGGVPAPPAASAPLIAPTPFVSTSVDSVEPSSRPTGGVDQIGSSSSSIGPTPSRVSESSPYGKDWEYKQKGSVVMAPPAPNRQPPKPTAKPFFLDKLIN